MLPILAGLAVSYLIGSIPTAFIFVKLLKGLDIRTQGSGNVGATNAFRVLGKGPGITVLLLDILKGIIPVIALGAVIRPADFLSREMLLVCLGLAAIGGHNWTVFLNFKGGKGIATTLGVLIGLALTVEGVGSILGLVLLTWAMMFAFTRIVSVASLAAAISLPVFLFSFRQPFFLLVTGILLSSLVILRHIPNIRRMFHGQEPRLKFK